MEKFLVVKGSGGLSNRIQAVAGGILYCLLSGRTLVVDWRDSLYSNDFVNVFPLFFEVSGLRIDHRIPLSGTVYPDFWGTWLAEPIAVEYFFKGEHLEAEHVARTCIDVTRFDYEEDVVVAWAPDMRLVTALAPLAAATIPGFAGCSDKAIFRILFAEYIKPAREITEAVDAFAVEHFKAGATVGVHIRHTDLQSPVEAFIKTLMAMPGLHESVIFLATDNRFVQQSLKRIFKNIVHIAKYFPAGTEPLHSHFRGVDNIRKGRDALVDMFLLSRCDAIVHYEPSSFARVPILLSGLPGEKIFAISGA